MSRQSGGESLRVDDAGALEATLSRLRQRYALHFNLPDTVKPGQEGDIEVQLSAEARRRYPDAHVRFNRMNLKDSDAAPISSSTDESIVVSQAPVEKTPPVRRRRPGVSDGSSRSTGPIDNSQSGGWRRAEEPPEQATPAAPEQKQPAPTVKERPAASEEQPKQGGWRKVKPGEQP
jgi:hypothetical protein